jgi:hypothetical protein
VALASDFSKDTGNWWVGQDNSDFANGSARIESGEYHWKITAKKDVIWRITHSLVVSDFVLAADTRQDTGTTTAENGLIFRFSNNGFYYFGIGNSYYFVACSVQGQWTTLIERTVVPGLSTSFQNRLKVVGEGTHFLFFINDDQVGEIDDDRISAGQVGLAVGLFKAGDRATFAFDNVEVRAP